MKDKCWFAFSKAAKLLLCHSVKCEEPLFVVKSLKLLSSLVHIDGDRYGYGALCQVKSHRLYCGYHIITVEITTRNNVVHFPADINGRFDGRSDVIQVQVLSVHESNTRGH